MKNPLFWIAITLGVVFLFFLRGSGPAQNPAEAVPLRVEYKVLEEIDLNPKSSDHPERLVERGLNRLGDDGWELVTVRAANPNWYILKRVKPR
jgi:hypothetical protein